MSTSRHRRLLTAASVVLPSAAALTVSMLAASAPARAAGDGTRPVPGTQPAWVRSAADAGAAPSSARLTTQLFLAGDRAGLTAYAQAVSDPRGRDYQKFLSPAQVQHRFGATASQVSAVESWLRSSGLRVRRVSMQQIDATGTVAETERAYGTALNEYKTRAGTFRAPATDARVPAGLSSAVAAVSGLDSRPALARPASLVTHGPLRPERGPAPLPMSKGADGAPFLGPTPCSAYYGQLTDTTDPEFAGAHQPYAICGYTPAQLRGAYGLTPNQTGRGVTVAIVDAYASPTLLADANQYAVNQGGQPFAPGQFTETTDPADWDSEAACGGPAGWAPEQSLDVEAVHAMAPQANVRYYGANSCEDADFLSVLSGIVDTRSANIITDSWGEVIYSSTGDEPAATITEYSQIFEQAIVEGIEVAFSSGDCGDEDPSTSCGAADTSTTPQADFPTSDPYVTSVGGTSLFIGARNQYEGATVWGDDGYVLATGSWQSIGWVYGGGGGTSQYFPQPVYQRGSVPTKLAETLPDGSSLSTPMRVAPDVAMDADPFTGFLFGMTQTLPDGSTAYAESDIGGTSLASPLFAGLVADGVQSRKLPRGFMNPLLYLYYHLAPWRLHDILPVGSSVPYDALPAYSGQPAILVQLGDDQALKATVGYDDGTGVGMPGSLFLSGPALWFGAGRR
jgi:subtilase family serine protease